MERLGKLFGKVMQVVSPIFDAAAVQDQIDENNQYMELDLPYDENGDPLPDNKTRSVKIRKGCDA